MAGNMLKATRQAKTGRGRYSLAWVKDIQPQAGTGAVVRVIDGTTLEISKYNLG